METFIVLLAALLAAGRPSSYAELRHQGESFIAEKSFAKAHAAYEEASHLALTAEEKRWVEMRLADTAWRASEEEPPAEARKALEALARSDDHDRVYAEANESLGDLTVERDSGLNDAMHWYAAALDWWAGSDDLPLARKRYLAIVFRVAGGDDEGTFRYVPTFIPKEVLANAVAIADTPEDRAHARFLFALRLLAELRPESIERGLELLDEVIAMGKTNAWYDDALFAAATQLAQRGAIVVDGGQAVMKPDNVKALALYRRIVGEFARNETRYYDQARRAIATIESPSLSVFAMETFLPKSEQEVRLTWRNVGAVDFAVSAIDLTTDARVNSRMNWISQLPSTGRSVRRWTFRTNDRGDHALGSDSIRIAPRLEPGAYVVVATAGKERSQALLLVTDANVVIHHASGRVDAFVCSATTGEPIANARLRVWRQTQGDAFTTMDATTDADGLATIRLGAGAGTVVVFANANNRQAWISTWDYTAPGGWDAWQIYAFTDRPAYRPGEIVHWKFIARVRRDNDWTTPAKRSLDYDIVSPRGGKIASGTATLNEFGSFWADLPLTGALPLGIYTIQLTEHGTARDRAAVGYASLFRLEEYKLPEFRVDVKTAKQFRLGDTIEATIDASYYFGGPVANATVEAVVRKSPFVHTWTPWREYAWYFPPNAQAYGSEVKKETLKTDAQGRAVVRVETSADDGDSTYTIEARVTDASRREVDGEGKVNVTRQRYSVMAQPEHYLLRPNDDVTVRFKALDANDEPVRTTGTVKVVRRRWQQQTPSYRDEEVLATTTLATDKDGEATLRVRMPREGYYAVRWTSEDRGPGNLRARDLVRAETAVYVTGRATIDIGYHAAGLELIVDKESFRSGQTAPVMIVTPASGRWVLFTTSGGGILDTQLLHLDGTVKLVQLRLDDRHVPSFGVTASSVFDRRLSTAAQTIVVPPVEHFVNVEVEPDRAEYEPRQQGTVLVSARDVDGRPVRAEVALAVTNEAVTAIQSDMAGDPRKFFFGRTRFNAVNAAASVQMERYVNLVEEKGKLIDDRMQRDQKKEDEYHLDGVAQSEGVVGGVVGGVAAPPAPPAPKPMMRQEGVSESITVTAAVAIPETTAMQIVVRSDFRSTAFWQPDVITGADGTARVAVKFPEALTTWRASARAVTAATQVGMGSATATTKMPLIVRLEAPRFFVAGDRVTVSAVINNNTDAAMKVTPSIDVEGVTLETASALPAIDVPPHGETHADWRVAAERAGPATLRVTGRAAGRGDAMEKSFTVYEHGVDKLIARSGKLRGDDAVIKLDLPHDRRATALTVRVQPSLAAMMLDALPYLIDYPYGCTEQTMSRFLPAAIVARTLRKNGRNAGGLNEKIDDVAAASTARLYDFQHPDGGWGWWKQGDSDDFMTAYVVWGFAVAKEGGLEVDDKAVNGAVQYLDRRLVGEEDSGERQAWMLHAIGAWRAATHDMKVPAEERKAIENVWRRRERLSSYSRALFALAAHDFGDSEKTAVLVRNLEDGVKIDRGAESDAKETMATARWGAAHFWWHWYDGPVESTAFALQALVRIDPQNKLIEPAMNWLVKNRRGAQWNNTRDTAIAVLALNDYLTASGELQSDATWDVTVNGVPVSSTSIAAALVRDDNVIRIHRTSGKALYFAVEGRFVSLEEPVKAAGNEIFVKREYVRLAPKPTLLKGLAYDRVPLADGGAVDSGDRVEVVVTIESKNDYEYLLFEDLKPAGLEAVSLRSGEPLFATSGNRSAWVYQELRDRKVALFIDHLPQGTWELRYTLRAEVPGTFHALPILGQAMYVPEIHANGDEARVVVRN